MRFCPKCGKSVNKGAVFCDACSLPEETRIKDLPIRICNRCSSIFYKGRWTRYDSLEDSITRVCEEKTGIAVVNVELRTKKILLKNGQSINIKIFGGTCSDCGKKGTHYFEGILQLRNPNDEVIEFIKQEVEKHEKRKVSINDFVETGKGIDLYVSSQHFLQILAKSVHNRFGGIIKLSRQLFSKDNQTSKDIYRINILLQIPEYRQGDVVQVNSRLIQVKGFGSRPSGIDLATGKTAIFDYMDDAVILEKLKATVSKKYPQLEIIHPQNFDSVAVENPAAYNGKNGVRVVLVDGHVYLVE